MVGGKNVGNHGVQGEVEQGPEQVHRAQEDPAERAEMKGWAFLYRMSMCEPHMVPAKLG